MALDHIKGIKGISVPLWLPAADIEQTAMDQIFNVAALPWVERMAVMPDVHAGAGATIGTVIGMKGAVSPSAVGVDVGCGMGAVMTNLDADEVKPRLKELRAAIEAAIPVGFNRHPSPIYTHAPDKLMYASVNLMREFYALTPDVYKYLDTAACQLGTLGGGNHFIEMNLDVNGNVWLMLHSGSRRIGKEIADVYVGLAKLLPHNIGLPDMNLAVLLQDTPEMRAYWHDLQWAQRYADLNRRLMMWQYWEVLKEFWPECKLTSSEVWCHHNYASNELHGCEELVVTRKGAISAREGEMGIIPGAMGAKSYIVRGRGCEEAMMSAPHGAGRKMSRSKARKTFTLDDIADQTADTECKKDKSVLDELPGAYKPIDTVITHSLALVDIAVELSPALLCVKG